MIRSLKEMPRKEMIEIDLSGPDGNAYNLLALASTLSKSYNLDGKAIQKQMMISDYDNLILVFDNYFGGMVNLYK